MKNIYTTLTALMLISTVLSQSPEKMSYQAIVRDTDNNLLIEQTVGMKISILQSSATGLAVYVETQTPTSNSNGLVTIEIGSGVSDDDFSSIDWANGPFFINTEIDPTGGSNYTITGTSQLLSVPYALYAKNSGHWHFNENTIYTYKNVSIGTDESTSLFTLSANSTGTTGRKVLGINNLSNDYGSASRFDISAGTGSNKATANLITFSKSYSLSSEYAGYTVLNTGYDLPGLIIRAQGSNGLLRFLVGGNEFDQYEKMQINKDGLIKATEGDIFIQNITKGVIMKSPDGQCWRMTVSNEGTAVFTAISCPE